MEKIFILDQILLGCQFVFIIATFFLVLYEFKEVLKYEQENEEKERQEGI